MKIYPSWSGARRCAGSAAVLILAASIICVRASEPLPAPAIQQELRSFRELGSVLLVAAHPDDENNQLLAYLARGRDYRTAYLSLTRGDGGQNVLGPELGPELGVLRTQELLAARSVDGARQYFSRAFDFGYSKDYLDTLKTWDREQVVADIVRVIREFRPDVIVTRFSPLPSNTHGHHTASAVLALEAFKLAGDPKAFPDQLTTLQPWQPKRIMVNGGGGGRGAGAAPPANTVRMDDSGTDAATGESFAQIAARSRQMHKTQGFGNTGVRGGAGGETFSLLDGEPATTDLLDGVVTTWARYPGGADIAQLADDALAKFNAQDPAASMPALLALRTKLSALPTDPVVEEKRGQLDRILQSCLGLSFATVTPQAEVVPGEILPLHETAMVTSKVPVRWLGVNFPGADAPAGAPVDLQPNQPATRDAPQILPAKTPLSTPYWLREEGTPGMARVDDPALIGLPENPPVFPLGQVFSVGGQTLVLPDEPVQVTTAADNTEIRRRLDVIAPVSLSFPSDVELFAPGAAKTVEVDVTAARHTVQGAVQIAAPPGWKVFPAVQLFSIPNVGDTEKVTFTVTAPDQAASVRLEARAVINGVRYNTERIVLAYGHIPVQLLQPPAKLRVLSLNLAIRGKNVGYLPGAGDDIAVCLAQMGYNVTPLTGADLTPEKLKNLDAVVLGIRAFEVRTDLFPNLPALFSWVEGGGNLIVQYNRSDVSNQTPGQFGPLALKQSALRITDEHATPTFLVPDHPALTTPNKITLADFDGWVQERGIYFPSQWDARFTPLLAFSDPGEDPLQGGLLVAKYGQGYVVYTGLVFFRELPAGVPGAFRLFANLVSLGK